MSTIAVKSLRRAYIDIHEEMWYTTGYMEGFNRILSLFIGLFVVIIVLFVIVKRFNLEKTFPLLGGPADNAPTPTVVAKREVVSVNTTRTAQSLKEKFSEGKTVQETAKAAAMKEQTTTTSTTTTITAQKGQPTAIPETGVASAFLPLMTTLLASGIYLRKRS